MQTPEQIQKEYYSSTSDEYDSMHLTSGNDPEHDFSLAYLSSLIEFNNIKSVLDVGAGTGRTMLYLKSRFPDLRIVGIEPVKELRVIGYKKGIKMDELIDGDGNKIHFETASFDLVCVFAVLHHVKKPGVVIKEMIRVSGKAVFISDSNNFGQGGVFVRTIKQVLNSLHLWNIYNLIITKGKGYKISEGDGLFYSYSVFNNYNLVRNHFENIHILNTDNTKGINLYRNASHIALFASKKI